MPSSAHVMCEVTVPGLRADEVTSEMRNAAVDAITAALPDASQLDGVYITRMVVEPTATVESAIQPGGRQLSVAVKRSLSDHDSATTIQFIVVPAVGALANTLDRIEARLILMSRGGSAAKALDSELNAAFKAAGMVRGTRSTVHEPQHVVPKKILGRTHSCRDS